MSTAENSGFRSSIGTHRPAPFAFDGVVRITGIGGGFLIFTVAVGFAAINTGNNSLYIGLAFFLGALLLSGLASKGGLKHIHVELTEVGEAWAGRPAGGILRLLNDSRVWNVRDVVVASDELAQPLLIPVLERGVEHAAHVSFLFARRGLVQLKRIDLYTRYPFGFFLKKRRVRLSGEVVVLPRLLDLEALRSPIRPFEGEHDTSNRAGAGTELHGFRDYVRGDSLRQIAWKKSAGAGRWILKLTESDAARVVHVAVDPWLPPGMPGDALEELISEAATCIHEALERDLEVVLSLPDLTLRGKAGEAARSMFRALALLEAKATPAFFPLDRNTLLFSLKTEVAE
jgi:uncharacterized protein (DUF58 family)